MLRLADQRFFKSDSAVASNAGIVTAETLKFSTKRRASQSVQHDLYAGMIQISTD